MTVEADEPGRVVLEGDVPKWDIMRKAVEAAANVPGVRVVDSELEYEPDYYPIFRYGAERYYGDGYYPYYPYMDRPPYAAPAQPAPMGRAIRPAPPVPGEAGGVGTGTQQRR
jgi:BON domain